MRILKFFFIFISLSIFEWSLVALTAFAPAFLPAIAYAFAPAYADEEKQPKQEIHRKRKVQSEKEAEGTEALNRFEGDPIPKSRYELNGQSLEVDPD